MGYVPNSARLFARRPDVYAAWRQLVAAVTENMDPRRYELVTVAAASELRSSYCTIAHGKLLTERFLEPARVRVVVVDRRVAGLAKVDDAVMDLTKKNAADET